MATDNEIAVVLLDATAADDAVLVERLTALVNAVYVDAERGLWRDGSARTTTAEFGGFVADGQIAVATTGAGDVVGSIRVHPAGDGVSEFGMLVAAPERRNTGVGRLLVDFAERDRRARGDRAMQLELLVPRTGTHPVKEFLKSWYGHRGYRLVSTRRVDAAYPHLAPLLATPCDLLVYEKPLPAGSGAEHP